MKKKNKILTLLLLILPIAIFIIGVKADSGFDSSWDSGSWDSGSSWSSGSTWDSGGSWGSSGGVYISGDHFDIVGLIIFAIIVYYFVKAMRQGKISNDMYLDYTKEVPDSEVEKILGSFNKNEFLNARFEDFKDIQIGWMNFDYDLLKTKLTDELYNQYIMQLDTLQVKNQKNVMSDFDYLESMITNIIEDKDKVTITLELLTRFYDYLEEDGKVVRGNNKHKNTMHYEITFVCNKESTSICPNCGAKLPKSNICDYCHTVVSQVGKDFVMSKKEVKRQR